MWTSHPSPCGISDTPPAHRENSSIVLSRSLLCEDRVRVRYHRARTRPSHRCSLTSGHRQAMAEDRAVAWLEEWT
ncbi:hypothetical protein GCM10009550_44040 [Actinocorallia libanotica]|uniref:Uncharacterized protein n=1 Tax=Actinocorallia libanotica TaxID=46162 RepID=A0ABP4C283_9ACTN